jgi:MSHA pilin protein MshB
MNKNTGFTMIELVVVIAILGILAAVALPRFMEASKDAHRAAVAGTAGALASSVALVRAQWEVNRSKAITNPNVNVGGFGEGDVDVNGKGWPIGISGEELHCTNVWLNVMQGSVPKVTGNDRDYIPAKGTPLTTCVYTYQRDGGNDSIQYDSLTGAVNYTFN